MSGQDYDDDWEDGDCWNCGGEGFVFNCFDGFCLDAEIGCDLCTKPCDVCRPRPRNAELDAVLADALAKAAASPQDKGGEG